MGNKGRFCAVSCSDMSSDFAIETEALQKVYRSRWGGREIRAVTDLTLRVPTGVKFGLLGPNGAGKTTFVKMLLSAVNPTSGSARLFGNDARIPESRRPVGYLPENHRFPTYLTGAGMLDFYAALSGLDAVTRKRRIPSLLAQVGLETWGDILIKKYSKGMLQRLGLAQALIHQPRLLILDEPTDGVDPVGRREIRDVLNGLTGTGVTIFINSHLLQEVESFCEYVAILSKGQLALEGRVANLVAQGGYTVHAREAPESVRQPLLRLGSVNALDGGGIEVRVASLRDANAAIDLIRAAQGLVEQVTSSSQSLEDVFIRVTRGERAA